MYVYSWLPQFNKSHTRYVQYINLRYHIPFDLTCLIISSVSLVGMFAITPSFLFEKSRVRDLLPTPLHPTQILNGPNLSYYSTQIYSSFQFRLQLKNLKFNANASLRRNYSIHLYYISLSYGNSCVLNNFKFQLSLSLNTSTKGYEMRDAKASRNKTRLLLENKK